MTVSLDAVDGEAVFTCRDEGIGMSAEDVARLGTEFFRSSNPLAARPAGHRPRAGDRAPHRRAARRPAGDRVRARAGQHLPGAPAGRLNRSMVIPMTDEHRVRATGPRLAVVGRPGPGGAPVDRGDARRGRRLRRGRRQRGARRRLPARAVPGRSGGGPRDADRQPRPGRRCCSTQLEKAEDWGTLKFVSHEAPDPRRRPVGLVLRRAPATCHRAPGTPRTCWSRRSTTTAVVCVGVLGMELPPRRSGADRRHPRAARDATPARPAARSPRSSSPSGSPSRSGWPARPPTSCAARPARCRSDEVLSECGAAIVDGFRAAGAVDAAASATEPRPVHDIDPVAPPPALTELLARYAAAAWDRQTRRRLRSGPAAARDPRRTPSWLPCWSSWRRLRPSRCSSYPSAPGPTASAGSG